MNSVSTDHVPVFGEKRIEQLKHHYKSSKGNSSASTDSIKSFSSDFSKLPEDVAGRRLAREIRNRCDDHHVEHQNPLSVLVIPPASVYVDEYLKHAEPEMPKEEREMHQSVIDESFKAFAQYRDLIESKREELENNRVQLSSVTVDDVPKNEQLRMNVEQLLVEIEELIHFKNANYKSWCETSKLLKDHEKAVLKSREDHSTLAGSQQNSDQDANDRLKDERLVVFRDVEVILKACSPIFTQIFKHLDPDGSDPYAQKDFHKLLKRLDERYGALDPIGVMSLLVRALAMEQKPAEGLDNWLDRCLQLYMDLKETIPDGSITLETLVGLIILRGLDDTFMKKYLASTAQLKLFKSQQRGGLETDSVFDDNASIRTFSEPDLLASVQDFIKSEISQQDATKHLASMSVSAVKKVSSTPLSANVVYSNITNNGVLGKSPGKNTLKKFDVCAEYYATGECGRAKNCKSKHLPKGTTIFCGQYLMNNCTKSGCPLPHIDPINKVSSQSVNNKPSGNSHASNTIFANLSSTWDSDEDESAASAVFVCELVSEMSTNSDPNVDCDISFILIPLLSPRLDYHPFLCMVSWILFLL